MKTTQPCDKAYTNGSLSAAPISPSSEDIVTSIPRILKPLAIALETLSSSAIALFWLIKL
ncbi:hypothetical protein N0824_00498 [Microcystis sp. 0824]|uniref:hypothetical protein n=1 Tax=Microcystis sp. 0824 TaxID=1502726 RepID=UPI000D0C220A|nr:hypothetical protein [Microcystis sp. 0824]GBF52649.1 hypothetical protein N0824_00498 [Microcystis sp. 0824]